MAIGVIIRKMKSARYYYVSMNAMHLLAIDNTVTVEAIDSATHSLLISQFNKLIKLVLHWLHK